MSIVRVVESLSYFDSEPPGCVIDELLEAGGSLDEMSEMLAALMRSPKVWSARLLGLPAVRLVRDDPGAAEALAPRVLDVIGVVQPLGDWSASSGWLGVLGVLAEGGHLRPRSRAEQQVIVDLLRSCLSDGHPNARSAAVQFLEILIDFGHPSGVLGDQGAQDLRRVAEGLILTSGSPGHAGDLTEMVELLGSIDRAAE